MVTLLSQQYHSSSDFVWLHQISSNPQSVGVISGIWRVFFNANVKIVRKQRMGVEHSSDNVIMLYLLWTEFTFSLIPKLTNSQWAWSLLWRSCCGENLAFRCESKEYWLLQIHEVKEQVQTAPIQTGTQNSYQPSVDHLFMGIWIFHILTGCW